MYYLLIPILAFIFFIRIFSTISVDINHKFQNFDYKYSYNLRSYKDLRLYIDDLNYMELPNKNYDLKILPPYSDYNINQKFSSDSSSLGLFYKD